MREGGEKEWKERDGALYHVSLRIVSILAHKTLVAIAQKGDSVWVPRLFCKAQRRRMSEIQEEEEVTAAIMRRVRVLKPGEQSGCLMRWKCSGWPREPGMGFSLWKSSISNEWRLAGYAGLSCVVCRAALECTASKWLAFSYELLVRVRGKSSPYVRQVNGSRRVHIPHLGHMTNSGRNLQHSLFAKTRTCAPAVEFNLRQFQYNLLPLDSKALIKI
jgi:hypothetical protein